jgi:hypothetical protein
MKALVFVALVLVMAVLLAVLFTRRPPEPARPAAAEPAVGQPPVAPEPPPALPRRQGEAAAPALEPIAIELPRPMFEGTPRPVEEPNVEEPLGKPRPPFLAPEGTVNLALGRPVTSSDPWPVIGELELVTDGEKEATAGSFVELGPATQWVQIDLGRPCTVYAVVVWHYHTQARVYRDVVVQVAADPDFTVGVETVFNNDHESSSGLGVGTDLGYVETFEGKLIPCDGVEGRYVRLYSRGNSSDEGNHYTEVEVHGKPVQ